MWNITRVRISKNILAETVQALCDFGRSRNEGLVLWLGHIDGLEAEVTQQLVPPQNPIRSESGVGYFVNDQTLLALNRFLSQQKLRAIAQIHSHPGRAYHSAADDRYAIITKQGGFSLVVPNFGFGQINLASWAIYRLSRRQWVALTEAEKAKTFQVIETSYYREQKGSFSVLV